MQLAVYVTYWCCLTWHCNQYEVTAFLVSKSGLEFNVVMRKVWCHTTLLPFMPLYSAGNIIKHTISTGKI